MTATGHRPASAQALQPGAGPSVKDEIQNHQYDGRNSKHPANDIFTHDHAPVRLCGAMGTECPEKATSSVRYVTQGAHRACGYEFVNEPPDDVEKSTNARKTPASCLCWRSDPPARPQPFFDFPGSTGAVRQDSSGPSAIALASAFALAAPALIVFTTHASFLRICATASSATRVGRPASD